VGKGAPTSHTTSLQLSDGGEGGAGRKNLAQILAEHRAKTKDITAAVELANVRVQEMWRDHHAEDLEKRRKASQLRRKSQELALDITKCRCNVMRAKEGSEDSDCTNEQGELISKAIQRRARLLRRLPRELTFDRRDDEFEHALETRIAKVSVRCAKTSRLISEAFRWECDMLGQRYRLHFAERESQTQSIAAEVAVLRAHSQSSHERFQADVASALLLESELQRLLIHPETLLLPRGTLEVPITPLSQMRDRLEREQVLPCCSLDILRQDLSVLRQQVLQVLRPAEQKERHLDVTGNMWDVQAFAREFCARGVGTGECLASSLKCLSSQRLRLLCLALWRRANMPDSCRRLEKDLVREQVHRELRGHDRVDEIRRLERDITAYHQLLAEAEARACLLGSAMSCAHTGSCKLAKV